MKNSRYLALIEQAIISGSNFLLFLYAARSLSKEDWGELTLALGVVLVIQGFQRAFVIIPLVTSGVGSGAFSASFGFWNRVHLIISFCLFFIVFFAYANSLFFFDEWLQRTLAYSCCLIFPIFYLEFSRRVIVISSTMQRLVIMAMAYVLAMVVVIFLGSSTPFVGNPWMFVGALVFSSLASIAVSGVKWLSNVSGLLDDVWNKKSLWDFGKWAAASSLAYTGYNFAIQAILASISGPIAVGVFAAARNLIQPVNTLIQAIDTVDKPRSGRAYTENGIGGLWGVILRSWGWMLIVGIPYLLIVFLFAEEILFFLYGDKYQEGRHAAQLWCLVAIAMMFTQPLETGLYVVRRPKWLFYGRVVTAGFVLTMAPLLIKYWSFLGALFALFCAWLLAGLCAAFQLRKFLPGEAPR